MVYSQECVGEQMWLTKMIPLQ